MPDDPEIEDMDPIMKAWMFYSWNEDYSDEFEMLKNHGYLIGSFINPEAVRKAMGKDSTAYNTSEKEFEESTKMVEDDGKQQKEKEKLLKRRKRKKLVKK